MCQKKYNLLGLAGIILGVILGLIVFYLFDNGVFAAPAFIPSTMLAIGGFVLLFIAITALVGAVSHTRHVFCRCVIKIIGYNFIGILGSLAFSIAAFTITAAATVWFNIAVALSAVFGTIALVGLFLIIKCLLTYSE